MMLKILLPTMVLFDQTVSKVIAEGVDGAFCILPKHVDFVSALVPGILSYLAEDGRVCYVAVDEGILVKKDSIVRVSTRHAVQGTDLGNLRRETIEQFELVDERERMARSAVARIEADFFRRFLQLGEPARV